MSRFSDATTPEEIIAQAVGCGSLCWMPRPDNLEFDSEEATKIVNEAVERLAEVDKNYCKAALNVAGAHFQCDIPVTEDGTHGPFAHGNTEAKAIWCSHDESVHAS